MSGDKISSEDVELVALLRRAVCDPGQFVKRGMVRAVWHSGEESEDLASWQARAISAALAGRLLPAGGQTETEWRVSFQGVVGERRAWARAADEKHCRRIFTQCKIEGRWPKPQMDKRTVIVWPTEGQLEWPRWTGPWLPVEEGTQP